MPILTPLIGTVTHYNQKDHYGFIEPEVPRADNRQIHFHRNNGSQPYEEMLGYLDFSIDSRVEREPKKGDKIVYFEILKSKGPQTLHWTYLEIWQNAERQIAIRPNPYHRLIRVTGITGKRLFERQVIWEGFYGMLIYLYQHGGARFLDNEQSDLTEKAINTWLPIGRQAARLSALNGNVYDTEYYHQERFYLAYLIEEGVRLCKLQPSEKKKNLSILLYAVIGRLQEVSDNKPICEASKRLPHACRLFKDCAAVNSITGISANLLAIVATGTNPTENPQIALGVASYLRQPTGTEGKPDESVAGLDKYMKHVTAQAEVAVVA